MKRQRKRAHVFHAGLLSIVLIAGLVAPASASHGGSDNDICSKDDVVVDWKGGGTFEVNKKERHVDDCDLHLGSYTIDNPDWDGSLSFGPEATPQSEYAYERITVTSKKPKTKTISLPEDCGGWQVDVYTGERLKQVGPGGHGEDFIAGGLGGLPLSHEDCQTASPPIPDASAESTCDELLVTLSVGGDESGNTLGIFADGDLPDGTPLHQEWLAFGESTTVDVDPNDAPVTVSYLRGPAPQVWADSSTQDLPDHVGEWPRTFQWEQPADCTVETKLRVKKLVTGTAQPHPNTSYDFEVDCGDGVEGLSLKKGSAGFVEVAYPANDPPTCTITEVEDNGATAVSNSRMDGDGHVAQFVVDEDWKHNKIDFTNHFDPEAKFKVHKAVDGNGPAPDGDFDFEWQCGNDNGTFSLGDGDHSGWIRVTYSGHFVHCTVTETDTQDADHVSNTAGGSTSASFWISRFHPKQVTFTNTFDLPPAVSTQNTCEGVEVTIDANDTRRTWRVVGDDDGTIEEFWLEKGDSKTVLVGHALAPFTIEWRHGSDWVPFTGHDYDGDWTQPDDCLEISAEPICVAGETMIFTVTGSNQGGPDGQEITFHYRPAFGGFHTIQTATVETGDSTLVSSDVGAFGKVWVRIDGGTWKDRIRLKTEVDCTPSVTLEKEWDGLTDEQLESFGVSVSFEDQDENTYDPGDTIDLEPGASIELSEHVDGLPTGCTWAADEGELSWTAPDLEDLEAYLELWGSEDGTGFHHVLTATNTLVCGDPAISLVKEADQTEFTFGAGDDLTYDVTYTYTITNDGDLDLDALTLEDEVLTEGVEQVIDLDDELHQALEDGFGSTTLAVGDSVQVALTLSYHAEDDPSQIDNIATVTGTDPFDEVVTDDDDESISVTIVFADVEEEPEEEPAEVERVSVEREIETEVLAESLPRTGASILALLVGGLLALLAGSGLIRRRGRRS